MPPPLDLVLDVVTEGSSLLNNYRSQFRKIIKKQGFAELMRRMRTKLEKGEVDERLGLCPAVGRLLPHAPTVPHLCGVRINAWKVIPQLWPLLDTRKLPL